MRSPAAPHRPDAAQAAATLTNQNDITGAKPTIDLSPSKFRCALEIPRRLHHRDEIVGNMAVGRLSRGPLAKPLAPKNERRRAPTDRAADIRARKRTLAPRRLISSAGNQRITGGLQAAMKSGSGPPGRCAPKSIESGAALC